MTILFLVFVTLVVLHFVIEGILAPSERSKVRLELFRIRDEVRRAKINQGSHFDDELYDHLQSHVNKSIHLLHNYNLIGIFRALRSERMRDELWIKVEERTQRFDALLNESKVPGLYRLHIDNLVNTAKGFVYNSMGWAPFLFLPILLVAAVLFATRMVMKFKSMVGRSVMGVLEMPERAFDENFPGDHATV